MVGMGGGYGWEVRIRKGSMFRFLQLACIGIQLG